MALSRGVLSFPNVPSVCSLPSGLQIDQHGTHSGDLRAEHLKHRWVVTTLLVLFHLPQSVGLRVQPRGFRVWWLIVCVSLTGLTAVQALVEYCFWVCLGGVSGRNSHLNLLNEDHPHYWGWGSIFFTFIFPEKPGLVLSIGELQTDAS